MEFSCRRILVPTDLSPFAESAVNYAYGLARIFHPVLHVLHVARTVEEMTDRQLPTGIVDPDSGEEHDEWLAGILGSEKSVRRIEAVRVGTDVAGTIARYAQRNEIDLIVMASHGRTGLRHLLMGSVAEAVLRAAPCPVLVIRPPADEVA